MGNSTSCSALEATLPTSTSVFLIAYICKSIVNMSFNPHNVLKKESDDSDDVVFIKQEIDLTQILSLTDYETSVTHVSESKYFKSQNQKYSIKSNLFLTKRNTYFK